MCLSLSQFKWYVVPLSEFCSRKEPHSPLSTPSHFILGLAYPWEGQGMTWVCARSCDVPVPQSSVCSLICVQTSSTPEPASACNSGLATGEVKVRVSTKELGG